MTILEALTAIMVALAVAGGPPPPPHHLVHLEEDIRRMAEVDAEIVGTRTDLHSDHVVARAMLAALRAPTGFRSNPPDGACSGDSCPAKGPMQVTFGFHSTVASWEEGRALNLPFAVTREQLREAFTNVRFGYAILWHWKTEAARAARVFYQPPPPPAVWFDAYHRGRLAPVTRFQAPSRLDPRALADCRTLSTMLSELERLSLTRGTFRWKIPSGWQCGHTR